MSVLDLIPAAITLIGLGVGLIAAARSLGGGR